ncbi:MAG TPA: phosphatase PAP2 family protein [Gemmatimonadaceae bacterium]
MSARSFRALTRSPQQKLRGAATLVALTVVAACSTDKPGPTALRQSAAESQGVALASGLASPVWQLKARDLVSAANLTPVQAAHIYPIMSVAQYLAVQEAEAAAGANSNDSPGNEAGGRNRLETDRGAVAGASVVALSYSFPASASALEALVTDQANAGPGGVHPAFAAGEAIGRAVGAQIVARTIADHFNDVNVAVPPVGPEFWTSSAVPAVIVDGGQLKGVTPWFITSSDQFKPAPPPAFGGPEFNAALAQIRAYSDLPSNDPVRIEQVRIATFWALSKGTPTTPGFWLSVPTDSGWVAAHGMSERETTHMYALASATMFDAQIGCWDEKLTAWLIRPWRADPAIRTVAAVGKPNHPSYPSGHSCLSSSAARVLGAFFPEKATQLDRMAEQAGLSRMYAGIHYSFDVTAGQILGRSTAAFILAADASGRSVLTPPTN